MENASKALIMAASILIGVLILSLMSYLFLFMSDYASRVEENLYAKEIYEFNAQFNEYDERDNLTAQDVITIVNLVNNYNSKFEQGKNDPQAIKVTGLSQDKINNILNNNLETIKIYKCKIKYGNEKVSQIIITEN